VLTGQKKFLGSKKAKISRFFNQGVLWIMFQKCLFLALLSLAILSLDSKQSCAQSMDYSGYTKSGIGYGCAFLPSTNSGQYFIQSWTYEYRAGGRTITGSPQYAILPGWRGNSFTWSTWNIPPNTTVTVRLTYGFTTNPSFTRTIVRTFTVGNLANGTPGVRYCW